MNRDAERSAFGVLLRIGGFAVFALLLWGGSVTYRLLVGAEPGAACRRDGDCRGWKPICIEGETEARYCTPRCESEADCPAGWSCEYVVPAGMEKFVSKSNVKACSRPLTAEEEASLAPTSPPKQLGCDASAVGEYPAEARAKGVSGEVILALDITAEGKVGEARVVKGLGYGLDELAAARAKTCAFTPATRAGAPVAYQIRRFPVALSPE
jgi:TonB family protein